FFISDTVMAVLDEMVSEVIAAHAIPKENIFIGGISASGTRALRYAQYCEQGKSMHGIKIKGVFSVDSPLDLQRFYESVFHHSQYFKEGMLWEANLMKAEFKQLFSGPPTLFHEEYKTASVFSHSDSLGGNARYLKNISLILFHEPDIEWWLNERGATYFDINSYDMVALARTLQSIGNPQVTLVTTSQKGYDHYGNRNCHSWGIVDEEKLTQWIVQQLE
ncbi:MAG: hypothetical protein LPK45_02635, partial [Bacteroidota bacterium]|nr:hypothetical protein [Bacteroidota bacterium]MDX5429936.1 hypothetical protein [Bacteroidota bacterium]MDX5468709.1 hypothetical protein [Bacteroidota bacterium]